jgi:hypothetical protein
MFIVLLCIFMHVYCFIMYIHQILFGHVIFCHFNKFESIEGIVQKPHILRALVAPRMIKCILIFYHSFQNFTCDMVGYSMTRCGIFCRVIYYLHMVNKYIGNIPWHGVEYFLRLFFACLSMFTWAYSPTHLLNVIAFQKPTMIKTSALILKVKHLLSSSNDQRKPHAEFINSRQWATFARFWRCTFNNQTFCLLKVCELLPTIVVKKTCFVIIWVEM